MIMAKFQRLKNTVIVFKSEEQNFHIEFKTIDMSGIIKHKNVYASALNKKKLLIREKEPVKIALKIIKGVKKHEYAFWIYNDYVEINLDLKAIYFKSYDSITAKIALLEQLTHKFNDISDSLIRKIPYTIFASPNFSNRVHLIQDSISNIVDKTYEDYIRQNPNSLEGLYALIKLASRPIERSRISYDAYTVDSILKFNFVKIVTSSKRRLQRELMKSKKNMPGKNISKITLTDALGSKKRMHKVFKGKIIVLDFWATWCGYCRQEHPNLLKIFNKYKSDSLQIVGLSVDQLRFLPIWKEAILKDKTGEWQHYLVDLEEIKKKLNVDVLPSNFIINSKGVIIDKNLFGKKLEAKMIELFGY